MIVCTAICSHGVTVVVVAWEKSKRKKRDAGIPIILSRNEIKSARGNHPTVALFFSTVLLLLDVISTNAIAFPNRWHFLLCIAALGYYYCVCCQFSRFNPSLIPSHNKSHVFSAIWNGYWFKRLPLRLYRDPVRPKFTEAHSVAKGPRFFLCVWRRSVIPATLQWTRRRSHSTETWDSRLERNEKGNFYD
jgi:hypothetical protein